MRALRSIAVHFCPGFYPFTGLSRIPGACYLIIILMRDGQGAQRRGAPQAQQQRCGGARHGGAHSVGALTLLSRCVSADLSAPAATENGAGADSNQRALCRLENVGAFSQTCVRAGVRVAWRCPRAPRDGCAFERASRPSRPCPLRSVCALFSATQTAQAPTACVARLGWV